MIRKIRFWRVHDWVGLVLVAVCWLLNWMLPGVRTAYLFFPLWLGMLILVMAWPKIFYPFTWTSLVLIFEPVNYWMGRPHFLQQLRHGDWRTVVSLALGGLVCGFFWEMWNYYSFPKWIYHIPGVAFLRIFEMPLLGYGGYMPFAMELYILRNFFWPKRA